MTEKARRTLVTPVGILSYPALHEARSIENPDGTKGKPKYSIAIVWPEGTDLTEVNRAVLAAAAEKWGESAALKLRSGALYNPIRSNPDDVAEKRYPKGSAFTNARSDRQPGMVFKYADPKTGKPMVVPTDKVQELFYAGALVRAEITFFAYDKGVKKGVGVGLNNVQLWDSTTPRMDGRNAAADAFTAEGVLAPADLSDLEGDGDA